MEEAAPQALVEEAAAGHSAIHCKLTQCNALAISLGQLAGVETLWGF